MNFYKHSLNTSSQRVFQKLLQEFGFAGYGFYWYLVEEIEKNDGQVAVEYVTKIGKYGSLSARQKQRILSNDYGLFVSAKGILTLARTRVTPLRARRVDAACPLPAHSSVPPVPCSHSLKIDKIDKSNMSDASCPEDSEADQFVLKMKECYPFLMSLKRPLTKPEYDRLVERFSEKTVNRVIGLVDNTSNVEKRYNYAYRTILEWCKRSKRWETAGS